MDKLIKYFNARYGDIQLRYSTPSEYLRAIGDQDVKWPTKYDDMFPYADSMYTYWTGYFTSRANDKEYTRRGSHNFHSSAKLYAMDALYQITTPQRLVDVLNMQHTMLNVMGVL